MGEPLKNKGKKIVLDTHLYFKDKEIKSAIEWLKEQINKDDKEAFNCWQLRRENVLKLIDKAFPDLIHISHKIGGKE